MGFAFASYFCCLSQVLCRQLCEKILSVKKVHAPNGRMLKVL